MSTDPWGVVSGYEDTARQWHATSAETHRAILAAMGIDDPHAVPATDTTVRVVYPEDRALWRQPGRLLLEDGGELPLTGALPEHIPGGYHQFLADGCDTPTRLILTPGRCPLPQRMWGWACQLYATRSQQSWGIGDLADLRRLARWSAELQAKMLLVNPLGAAAPVLPQATSPYYADSRRFLNPLYLRVEEVPGAEGLGERLQALAAAGQALNTQRQIDRDEVFRLKQQALQAIWERFAGDADFTRYCQERGRDLEQFAAFSALAVRWGGDWRGWPAEYRRSNSPAVQAFVREHPREIQYHQWQQWLLDRQLARAAAEVSLVHDLPIGVAPGGADAWAWQDLLAERCSIGAPPDAFNAAGQDWGMPPWVPHKLRGAGYEPFIQTIRAALRHAGGLRIDHVMGLFRLFWIPHGFGPARGAYVRYPSRDLLGIVALESQRAGAMVVGEDLGTVEHGVREELLQRQMLSFRVLWFEEKPPVQYPVSAMAAATTHDLPTIAGLWTGADLAAQRAMGQDADESMAQLRSHLCQLLPSHQEATVEEAIAAAYALLAESPSLVLSATLDDALAVPERPNMPGTTTAWPNWCLALPGGLEALEHSALARRIARALTRPQ